MPLKNTIKLRIHFLKCRIRMIFKKIRFAFLYNLSREDLNKFFEKRPAFFSDETAQKAIDYIYNKYKDEPEKASAVLVMAQMWCLVSYGRRLFNYPCFLDVDQVKLCFTSLGDGEITDSFRKIHGAFALRYAEDMYRHNTGTWMQTRLVREISKLNNIGTIDCYALFHAMVPLS